jgi:hypothetical protein
VKQPFSVLWVARKHHRNLQCYSHGRACAPWWVSPCCRAQRFGRASTKRGAYNSYAMRFWLVIAALSLVLVSAVPANAQVNVTQYHNHDSRDGLYVDAAFTQSAATSLARDLGFDGTVSGNVYAQPLYVEGGPNGTMVIVATESNNVYALDATDGSVIWQRNGGTPVPLNQLPVRQHQSDGHHRYACD